MFFRDEIDDIYSKDDNLRDFKLQKIIYIHEIFIFEKFLIL
jgi:hypothetical protein